MIVKDGIKTNKNDDAHYITINDKGCYESNKDGFSTNDGFIKFTKNENNIHCYYGDCSFGMAHYYFSSDYSRLNVRINDNLTYVYQRELSGKTTAKRRTVNSGGKGGTGGSIVIPPVLNNNVGGSVSGSSSSKSRSSLCKYCNGSGICYRCGGKRGSWEYTDWYTGDGTKSWINCGACNGNARCSVCRGSGRIN